MLGAYRSLLARPYTYELALKLKNNALVQLVWYWASVRSGPTSNSILYTPRGDVVSAPLFNWSSWHAPELFSQTGYSAAGPNYSPPRRGNSNREVGSRRDSLMPTLDVLISLRNSERYVLNHLRQVRSMVLPEKIKLHYFLCQETNFVRRQINRLKEDLGDTIQIIDSDQEVGLYAAWNTMISASSARYLTNWNVDDWRAPDYFSEIGSLLARLRNVDVFFSNFYVANDFNFGWSELSRHFPASRLRHCSLQSMLFSAASPHAAVVWKREIHNTVGTFSEIKSAGDLDFWVRSASAGFTFYLDRRPLYGYYFNPTGLSTSRSNRDTNLNELKDIRRQFGQIDLPSSSYEQKLEDMEAFLCRRELTQ